MTAEGSVHVTKIRNQHFYSKKQRKTPPKMAKNALYATL